MAAPVRGGGEARPPGEAGRAARRADGARRAGGQPRARQARRPSASSAKLDWPGKPAPVVEVVPLTPPRAEAIRCRRRAVQGHLRRLPPAGRRGQGKARRQPGRFGLREGPDPTTPIRILLGGKEGPIGLMPPLGGALNDEQIASVLTYIRREWGHTAPPVAPDDVVESPGTDQDAHQAVDRRGTAAGPGRPRRAGRPWRTAALTDPTGKPRNILDAFRLDGQVALVTGGARGLGLTMATALAEAGADIAISGRTRQACEEAVAQIAQATRAGARSRSRRT